MNTKTAKMLRKAAKYHPSEPKSYEIVGTTRENGATTQRYLYREMKKSTKAEGIEQDIVVAYWEHIKLVNEAREEQRLAQLQANMGRNT